MLRIVFDIVLFQEGQELLLEGCFLVMRRFGMFYSRRIGRARVARLAFGLAKSREDLERVIKEFFK